MSRFNSTSAQENNKVRGLCTRNNVRDLLELTATAKRGGGYDPNLVQELIREAKRTLKVEVTECNLSHIYEELINGTERGDILRPSETSDILGYNILLVTAVLGRLVDDGLAEVVRVRVKPNNGSEYYTYAYKMVH